MRSSAERGGRRAFVPIALSAFITSLDTTVVNTAQPSIMRDLHLELSGLEWVATSYVLAFATLLLLGGRLTDLAGRRTVLMIGMLVFGLASVVVALAPDLGVLLTGRCLQGAGAALVLPSVLAIVGADIGPRHKHLAAGVYTIAIGLSLALGPFVGGAISQYLDWTYIFWLNVPVVAIACATVLWAIPPSSQLAALRRIGVRGFVERLNLGGLILASLTLGSVTFALIEGQKLGYGDRVVWIALGVAVVALPVALVVGQRSQYKLIQLDMLKHPVVLGGAGIQVLWGLGINGVFFFTSIFLQDAMGFSPSVAGMAFIPLAVSLIIAVPFCGKLANRWGAHRTVGLGMGVVAIGMVAITFAGPGDGMASLFPGLALLGVGSALTTPLTSACLEMVPPSRVGMVSAMISVSREVSGVLGIAVTGAVLTLRETAAQNAGATPGDAFLAGYRTGLLAGAVLALAGGFVALRTLRPGQEMLADRDTFGLAETLFDDLPPEHPEAVAAETRAPETRAPEKLAAETLRSREDAVIDLLDDEAGLTAALPAGVAELVIDDRDEVIYPGR